MKLIVAYEGQTEPIDYPGQFEAEDIELTERAPVIGEAISLGSGVILEVTWVLWRLDGHEHEVHTKPHAAYANRITRATLVDAGLEEVG